MGSNVSESGGLWSSGFKFFYWGIGPPVITLFVFARWEEGAAVVVPMGFSSVERLLCAWH